MTQSAALLLAAGLATLTVMGVVQPWHILVFSFLNATVLAFDNPARQALLPELVEPVDLMHANSLNSWSFNSAVLLGPALAAPLLPLIGIGGVFYLNAVSFTAVLVALALSSLAMANDVGPVTVRTMQDLENHDATRSRWGWSGVETLVESSISTPVRHLPRDIERKCSVSTALQRGL
jgi:MFS family permease